jgi:hypothetical protein
VGEQRYKAVMAVLGGGRTVTEVAQDWEVSRQTVHSSRVGPRYGIYADLARDSRLEW